MQKKEKKTSNHIHRILIRLFFHYSNSTFITFLRNAYNLLFFLYYHVTHETCRSETAHQVDLIVGASRIEHVTRYAMLVLVRKSRLLQIIEDVMKIDDPIADND